LRNWHGGLLFATGALGAGIDIKSIKSVIHLGMPYGAINFDQEVGRGGREGQIVDSIIVITDGDFIKSLAEDASTLPPDEAVMREFIVTEECRRVGLSQYMNGTSAEMSCTQSDAEMCDNCLGVASGTAARKRRLEADEERVHELKRIRVIVGEAGKIIASCSSRNVDLVKQLGADEVIDYTSVNIVDHLSQKYPLQFDLILDNAGSLDLYNATPKILKDTGEFVAISTLAPGKKWGYLSLFRNLLAALFLPKWLGGVPRPYVMKVVKVPAKEDFNEIAGFIERKEIKPIVDSVWNFDDQGVSGGYHRVVSGHPVGKVIVKIRE